MPSFAKDVLFNANLINTLLDRNSKSCKEMAIAVNKVIEPHLCSHKFFSDIRKAIEPHLEMVVDESMGAQP
jgi:hypothetical protein